MREPAQPILLPHSTISSSSSCMESCFPDCMVKCARRDWPSSLCQRDCKAICSQSCGITYATVAPEEILEVTTLASQYQLAIQTNSSPNCILQCSQNCASNCHEDPETCKLLCQQNCAKICDNQTFPPLSQPSNDQSSCDQNCSNSCIASCTSRNFPLSHCTGICQQACTEACVATHQPLTLLTPSYQPDLSPPPIKCEDRCHIACMETCHAQNWSQVHCLNSCQHACTKACAESIISVVSQLPVTTPVTPVPAILSTAFASVTDSRSCLDECMT